MGARNQVVQPSPPPHTQTPRTRTLKHSRSHLVKPLPKLLDHKVWLALKGVLDGRVCNRVPLVQAVHLVERDDERGLAHLQQVDGLDGLHLSRVCVWGGGVKGDSSSSSRRQQQQAAAEAGGSGSGVSRLLLQPVHQIHHQHSNVTQARAARAQVAAVGGGGVGGWCWGLGREKPARALSRARARFPPPPSPRPSAHLNDSCPGVSMTSRPGS